MTDLDLKAFDIEPSEVDRRFEQAIRSGHPAWIWPEVERGDWRDALVAIEAATRAVLTGVPSSRIDAESPTAFSVAAYTSGMGPLLGYWLRIGRLTASPTIERIAELHLRHNEARMDRLGLLMGDAVRALARAGISATPLKGMHTGFEYFPDPSTRPVSDIDILVPLARFEDAERIISACGYERRGWQTHPRKSEWRLPGEPRLPRSIHLAHAQDPYSIDLHSSLDRNFFGVATVAFDAENLRANESGRWADVRRTSVQGDIRETTEQAATGRTATGTSTNGNVSDGQSTSAHDANVLGSGVSGGGADRLRQPLLTLFLAAHASEGLHNLTMMRLTELALVIDRDAASGALDWDHLLEMAGRTGALRFAWPALELCENLTPERLPPPVLERFRAAATPAMLRVVGDLTPATVQRIDSVLSLEERLMWAGSLREHLRRVGHTLWPAPAARSFRRLGAIYRQRAWRLMRGTVAR